MKELLTPRLKMVLSLTPKEGAFCDIGTDHGYIAIALAQRGVRVIAADINKGPLMNAEKNIRRFGLKDSIETRISDGFSSIGQGEVKCAVIAGMGGELIADILHKGEKGTECMVLQPQSAIFELRDFLEKGGFVIEDEELCREAERYYVAMRVRRGKSAPLGIAEKQIGPVLIKKRHPLLKEYLEYRKRELSLALDKIGDAQTPKRGEYEGLIKMYEQIGEDAYGKAEQYN